MKKTLSGSSLLGLLLATMVVGLMGCNFSTRESVTEPSEDDDTASVTLDLPESEDGRMAAARGHPGALPDLEIL